MAVFTGTIKTATKGRAEIKDVTQSVSDVIRDSGIGSGTATLFVPGSTAAISTIEYEPGLKQDVKEVYEKLIPEKDNYHHDQTWHDGNGHAHMRATLTGPSLTIPFNDQRLIMGTWQQIILMDFDNRPRNREIIVQIIGE